MHATASASSLKVKTRVTSACWSCHYQAYRATLSQLSCLHHQAAVRLRAVRLGFLSSAVQVDDVSAGLGAPLAANIALLRQIILQGTATY